MGFNTFGGREQAQPIVVTKEAIEAQQGQALKSFQDRVVKLKKEIEDLESKRDSVLDGMVSEKAELDNKIQAQKTEISALEDKLSKLQKALTDTINRTSELEDKADAAKIRALKEVEDEKKKLLETAAAMSERESQIKNQEQQLEQKVSAALDMERRSEKAKKEIELTEERAAKALALVADAERTLSEKLQALESKQAELAEKERFLNVELVSVDAEREKAKAMLLEASQKEDEARKLKKDAEFSQALAEGALKETKRQKLEVESREIAVTAREETQNELELKLKQMEQNLQSKLGD